MEDNRRDFDRAFDFTVGVEGGYGNDPDDPGGETNWGISKRAHPNVDIKNLTKEEAKEIYWEEYWKLAGCSNLEWPINMLLFDNAVNAGVSAAQSNWKEWGTDKGSVDKRVVYLAAERLEDYCDIISNATFKCPTCGLPRKIKYLKGWVLRVVALLRRM